MDRYRSDFRHVLTGVEASWGGAGRSRGLTLGKYAPLHRGHQLVIETALAEVDEVVVVIYDAPYTSDVPLQVRSDWIRALYPEVQVIEAWDGPTQVGYTSEIMGLHEAYLRKLLADCPVSHFYSSEPYGAHVSRALGAIDRRVDETRTCFPVSASIVRQALYEHRSFLAPLVYRDLVTNVVLLGAPSTGKTTLAERLAAEHRTCWMPEFGREYWDQHQTNRRLSPEQLVELAEEHLVREDHLLETANRFLFTDTNALTTATFARYYHGTVPPRLAELAQACGARYDLVLLCDTDIPYEHTWDRSGEVNRAAFQRQVMGDLHARHLPYTVISGSLDQRVAMVGQLLARFKKYANPLDCLPKVV